LLPRTHRPLQVKRLLRVSFVGTRGCPAIPSACWISASTSCSGAVAGGCESVPTRAIGRRRDSVRRTCRVVGMVHFGRWNTPWLRRLVRPY